MGGVDFVKCASDFRSNVTANPAYAATFGFQDPGNTTDTMNSTVTIAVCQLLCGKGRDYYAWDQVASTITTWVLPVIGILLQAPYESNKPLQTVLATCRWIGSPIASLSYILWNIKVTAKCAMMVDMSVGYRERPGQDTDFAETRDSLYILSVMNQYVLKPSLPGAVTEKLLRIALFSESLHLPTSRKTIVQHRMKLAAFIRSGRRRGAVPVFISLMWFVFSLILSIQQAFGTMGENRTAHDLALGCLLGWLPVLVLSSIVDRNPVVPDDIRGRLNKYLTMVRKALVDSHTRQEFARSNEGDRVDYSWIDDMEGYHLSGEPLGDELDTLFTRFAGQGRVRWHYGVAHPILAGIEDNSAAHYGRDWLRAPNIRHALVNGAPYKYYNDPLRHFDPREIWQIACGISLVGGTVAGAFILSYLTPTVGLGCRSGGYLNFFVIALVLLITEMLVWWITSFRSITDETKDWTRRLFARFLCVAEAGNTAWLSYIVMAQTIGSYRTCDCMGSRWGGRGGYINFDLIDQAPASLARGPWVAGTAVACITLGFGCAFIIVEWCCQSHLATADYLSAMNGLRWVRVFKRYTSWIRTIPDHTIEGFKILKWMVFGGRDGRRSLVWSWKVKPRDVQVIQGRPLPRSREGSATIVEDDYPSVSRDRQRSSPLLKLPNQSMSGSGRRSSTTIPEPPGRRSREGSNTSTDLDGYELSRFPSTNDPLIPSPTYPKMGT
ncbi:MAG: hypothetical protein M1836_002800 [Candelina mexicana]|nr:MAG: hypothetical protein M1836_002800 [Candelina mexicana]